MKEQLIELNKKDSIFQRVGCEDIREKMGDELRQPLGRYPSFFFIS